MCWDVLNDEWVSHPTWASEESAPAAAHKRNAYEDALHKTEEERHEYDYHIEANIRTIALLEPIANRIQQMEASERDNFKLKPGLGGQSKTIYQRILKKIYGKETGQEVINSLHDSPATAVPVVLERLKRKDDEWKKQQREWNKIWREVDAKNFYKSLDHQGFTFKVNDKRYITAKSLISEVEALRKEQTEQTASLIDPTASGVKSRGQYRFPVDDVACLQDVLRLILSYLDRMSFGSADKERAEQFMRDFIPLFFDLTDTDFDAAFAEMDTAKTGEDDSDEDMSEGGQSALDDDDSRSRGRSRQRKNGVAASDLRKKILRQAVEVQPDKPDNLTETSAPVSDIRASSEEMHPAAAEAAIPSDVPLVPGSSGMILPGDADRGETPVPPPADPAEVAKAVEKDAEGADNGEKTWIDVQAGRDSRSTAMPTTEAERPARRFSFFGNNSYFCFLRLLQVRLVVRLINALADNLAMPDHVYPPQGIQRFRDQPHRAGGSAPAGESASCTAWPNRPD